MCRKITQDEYDILCKYRDGVPAFGQEPAFIPKSLYRFYEWNQYHNKYFLNGEGVELIKGWSPDSEPRLSYDEYKILERMQNGFPVLDLSLPTIPESLHKFFQYDPLYGDWVINALGKQILKKGPPQRPKPAHPLDDFAMC